MFTRVSLITLLIIVSMSMALSMEISMEKKDKPAVEHKSAEHKPDPEHPVEDPEHKEKQGKFYFTEIKQTWDNLVCKIGFCYDQEAEKPANSTTAKPAEKPTEKPAEKPAETTPKPVETTHKPAK